MRSQMDRNIEAACACLPRWHRAARCGRAAGGARLAVCKLELRQRIQHAPVRHHRDDALRPRRQPGAKARHALQKHVCAQHATLRACQFGVATAPVQRMPLRRCAPSGSGGCASGSPSPLLCHQMGFRSSNPPLAKQKAKGNDTAPPKRRRASVQASETAAKHAMAPRAALRSCCAAHAPCWVLRCEDGRRSSDVRRVVQPLAAQRRDQPRQRGRLRRGRERQLSGAQRAAQRRRHKQLRRGGQRRHPVRQRRRLRETNVNMKLRQPHVIMTEHRP